MRLIDADDLLSKIQKDAPDFLNGSKITKAYIIRMIKTQEITPTVDAYPIVRCKECRHSGYCFTEDRCDYDGTYFCRDGKRRELK